MAAVELHVEAITKPWGRHMLAPWGCDVAIDAMAVGELIHRPPAASRLLIKTLFTNERLSVQVHPGDAVAQASGYPHGKEEVWLVLAAEPGATIGFGLKRPVSDTDLRTACETGGIVDLIDWRPVAPGDCFHVLPGTIHAIGAGVTLFEVQQNIDLTYRLFDYGRNRPLQLDEGLAVADGAAAPPKVPPVSIGPGHERLIMGQHFSVERLALDGAAEVDVAEGQIAMIAVLAGMVVVDGLRLEVGRVAVIDAGAALHGTAELLLAFAKSVEDDGRMPAAYSRRTASSASPVTG